MGGAIGRGKTEREMKFAPLVRRGTVVYLPTLKGGFDVRDCPDAEELAGDIVRAVNSHAPMLEVLKKIRDYHVNHHVLHEIDAAIKLAEAQ